MKRIIAQLERLTEDQLYTISMAIDDRLDRLAECRTERGFQRSTYLCDLARGRRHAPQGLSKAA